MTVRWNHYHEKLLKRWSQMAKTYSIMHSLTAQHFSRWDKRLGIPVVLLGTAASSSIFGSSDNGWSGMIFVNGGLVLLLTALSGITKFLGTAEKEVKHKIASFKYLSISMNIDTLLSFPRGEREIGPQEFITQEKEKILEIRDNLPEVKDSVMSTYLNKYDKTLISTKSKVNTTERSNQQLDFGLPDSGKTSDSKESNSSLNKRSKKHNIYRSNSLNNKKYYSRGNILNSNDIRPRSEQRTSVYDFNDPMSVKMTHASNILASDTSSSDTDTTNYQKPIKECFESEEKSTTSNSSDHIVTVNTNMDIYRKQKLIELKPQGIEQKGMELNKIESQVIEINTIPENNCLVL
jgi:hypothetical protein